MRCLALCLIAAAVAMAAAADLDPVAQARATELLAVTRTGELFMITMEAGVAQAFKPLLAQAPEQQRQAIAAGIDRIKDYLHHTITWESVQGEFVALYASTYTSAELEQLVAFYRSPLGQRIVETMPTVSLGGMEIGQRATMAHVADIQRLMMETMQNAQTAGAETAGLSVGKPFPALTLKTIDGGEVTIASLRGKVVLIDFWATWCGPCREELPNVRTAYDRFHDQGFEVVGVSLDEDIDKLAAFVKQQKIPWRQSCDGTGWQSAVAQRFGIQSIPATFLIGRDGTLVATDVRGDALDSAIEQALQAAAP